MKNIYSPAALAAVIILFAASLLSAAPVYIKYEDIKGSVVSAEVKNGKAVAKGLKAGTYKIEVIYTGPDAIDANGAPKTTGHVKVFDGTLSYSHLNKTRQGKATMQDMHMTLKTSDGQTSTAMGSGKVSLQDFHFVVAPTETRGEFKGTLGVLTIENKSNQEGKAAADTAKTSSSRDNWSDMYDFPTTLY